MAVQKRDRGGQIRWIGRYRGPDGKERSKTFETKKAAKGWVTEREREMRRGEWIDPGMGKITVGEVVTQWRDLTDNAGTRRVRQHLLGNLGDLSSRPAPACVWGSCADSASLPSISFAERFT